MDKHKLVKQMFFGKVADVIGIDKATKLLKESIDTVFEIEKLDDLETKYKSNFSSLRHPQNETKTNVTINAMITNKVFFKFNVDHNLKDGDSFLINPSGINARYTVFDILNDNNVIAIPTIKNNITEAVVSIGYLI